MLVTIESCTGGVCIWCRQHTDEAVDVAFHDGLKGPLCKKHFWEALKARADEQPAQTASRVSTKANAAS